MTMRQFTNVIRHTKLRKGTYNIQRECGLAAHCNVDTVYPCPAFSTARYSSRLCKDRTCASGLDSPAEHGTSRYYGTDGLDKKKPFHLPRMNHEERELHWRMVSAIAAERVQICAFVCAVITYRSKKQSMQSFYCSRYPRLMKECFHMP